MSVYGFDEGKNKAAVIKKNDIKWFTIRLSNAQTDIVSTYVEDFSLSSLVIGVKMQPSSMYMIGDISGKAYGVVEVQYMPNAQSGTNVLVYVTDDVVVASRTEDQVFHIYFINV